jgi:DNA-directed RNA polymerase beta' subunit
MKITKEQLQQIIKEELEEEMGGGMPDKAEIEEVLDDVLQNIRKNALSDDIAKQGARAEVLLSMLMGGRYAAEQYKEMFGERGLKGYMEDRYGD